MNTPEPIPAHPDQIKVFTYNSEFLFNKAKMAQRRKGLITHTVVKNIDGTFQVTWVPMKQPIQDMTLKSDVDVGLPRRFKKTAAFGIHYGAHRMSFSPGASHN